MLDQIDKSILKHLQMDAKMTIKELASKLNLTATPIYERIKRMEREGYIRRYSAVLDRQKLQLQLLVFCNISLDQHQDEFIVKFEKDIRKFPEVLSCYHIAGMYDYLIKVAVKDMNAYQEFVSKKLASLDHIGKVQSQFVMAEIYESATIPVDF